MLAPGASGAVGVIDGTPTTAFNPPPLGSGVGAERSSDTGVIALPATVVLSESFKCRTAWPACGSERAVVIAVTRNFKPANGTPEMFLIVRRKYSVCGFGPPAPSGSTISRFGAALLSAAGSSAPTCTPPFASAPERRFSGPGTPSIDGNADP